MNPVEMILNQMVNSPQIKQNPMAQNVLNMYKNGDSDGLKKMAENLCSAKGYTVDQVSSRMQQEIMGRLQRRR